MRLDIRRIARDNLRATGENNSPAFLVLCSTKDVVGSLYIVVQQRGIEIGVGICIRSEMDDGIDTLASPLTSTKIANIKEENLMVPAHISVQGCRTPVG